MTRARTFPHLSKEPNEFGSFEILWSEDTPKGWRTRRRSTKTGDKQEAEAALARFLSIRDIEQDRASYTLSEIFERYLRHHSRARGNEVSDRRNLRAPLVAFGDTAGHAITDSDVEAYGLRRQRGSYGPKAVSPATVRREITALQAVLNWGSRKHMIQGRPTFRFPKPADGAPRDLWLTEEQEQDVIAALPDAPISVRIFTRLGLTYGARKSAIMDLTFGPQVNFMTGIIDFQVPGAPVTRKRRPTAPMSKTVRADLEEQFERKGRGQKVCDRATPDQFGRFMEGIGYGWVTPHVLKHTAITLMLRNGERPEDVAKLTATDLRTILRVYRHHTSGEFLAMMDRRGI